MNHPFIPADILLPRDADMTCFACVACDQYTSEPSYWEKADAAVGETVSALRLVLPELYLNAPDVQAREQSVLSSMDSYLSRDVFKTYPDTYFYVERTLSTGAIRHGLVGALDLECYDYAPDSTPPVRATEGTVVSRIPPRLRIRSRASLELPHVLLLCDDREDTVLSCARANLGEKVYDFPLIEGSGSIKAWMVTKEGADAVQKVLEVLGDEENFSARYHTAGEPVLHLAVGDGNHSLATAKAHFENLKKELGDRALSHPARYALCELGNLHDESLVFEPIHRVVFDAEPEKMLRALENQCGARPGRSDGQNFTVVIEGMGTGYTIPHPTEPLCVGTLQKFLDGYIKENPCEIDYIHGEDVLQKLTCREKSVGFLLPVIKKEELFPAVIKGGVLPRKTFSMGNAADKRFYVEARKIK